MKTMLNRLLALSLLLFPIHAWSQVVTNGSVTGAPAANSGINSGNAAGWSVCAFSPDLCNTTFPSYSGNSQVARVASPDGGTWLGIAALGECAQTTITGLVPGVSYNLRFCGANFGTAALFNGSPAAPVITVVGGASVTLSIPQVANTWNPYQLIFTATAATMTLQCSIPNGSNAYASLDGFNLTGALCNPIILPVDFERFDGRFEACKVHLTWDAPTSEFASAFEVQRSTDGALFETLEKLEAWGQKSGQWVDAFPLEEAFYRIRMYNETGREAQSPVIQVSGQCAAPSIVVLGNPVTTCAPAFVKFTRTRSPQRLLLRDNKGIWVGDYDVPFQTGIWQQFELPTSGLSAGLYLLSTSDGTTTRFLITH